MRPLPHFLLPFVAALSLLAPNAGAQSSHRGSRALPVPAGNRVLGMDITDSQSGSFDDGVGAAKLAGASGTGLSVFWDELETAPGVFAPNPDWLAIANAYYPTQGMRIFLVINPIDTNQLRLPADLVGRAFDDPLVIQRFGALLDWAIPKVKDLDLIGISVGNEIDATLGSSPAAWSQYQTFLAASVQRIHTLRPGVPVGSKVTFDGLTIIAPGPAASLNGLCDQVFTTYYPLRSDFTVRPPNVFGGDMRRLMALYPGKQIVLAEVGYPSGSLVLSSEAMQAAFVDQVFAFWDRHPQRFPYVEFTWLYDISPSSVAVLGSYYGLNDPRFLDYLATLGFRHFSGATKPAYRGLRHGARIRGF